MTREEIEWIDIDDDEPHEEGLYLVCRRNINVNVAEWHGRYFVHPHVTDDMSDVTHWAELPSPPPRKKERKARA